MLTPQVAGADPQVNKLFVATLNQSTNACSLIKHLMEQEDLDLQTCHCTIIGTNLEIRLNSKLTFRAPSQTAKINFVLTFGPIQHSMEGDIPKQTRAQLEIFVTDNNYMLLVPKLVRDDESFAEMKKAGITFDQFYKGSLPIEYECKLFDGANVENILEWKPHQPSPNTLNLATLQKLDKVYKLSGNDELRLFTSMRVAKEGYYLITNSGEMK